MFTNIVVSFTNYFNIMDTWKEKDKIYCKLLVLNIYLKIKNVFLVNEN